MDIIEISSTLTRPPKYPERPYLLEGMTLGRLYNLATAINAKFKQTENSVRPVCLCTENRGLIAAALLAALEAPAPLLFPYAFTEQTLFETHKTLAYPSALTEMSYPLPNGVTPIAFPSSIDTQQVEKTDPAIKNPDDVWLYLYTGGSTGSPQIWSKSPRNLLMEAANIAKNFNIGSTDTILATVPPNHIYGLLYSVLLPLVSGARVSVLTPSFPKEIIRAIQDTQATVFVSIPAHFRALKGLRIANHKIHTAFSSAGALPKEDDQAFHQLTGVAITEIYGSTETGGIASRRRYANQPHLIPFSYVSIKIDDEQLRVNSDFLSKELQRDQHGFFLTADRVSQTVPPCFEIMGRADGIVKVGGKRVDLMQVQHAVLEISGVQDAFVFALATDSGRENEIVAVVQGQVTTSKILNHLKKRLISYALPRNVKVMDKIPLSATGKYNRKAIEKIVKSSHIVTDES